MDWTLPEPMALVLVMAALAAAQARRARRQTEGSTRVCGIVGYTGYRKATPILLEGLHRLEYRGYDSAGIAMVDHGQLRVTKAAVRVAGLRDLAGPPADAAAGIGHTRWATHGEPSDLNAHPHTDASGRLAVVHNGIVENAAELKAGLERQGVVFRSETDTEVLAHLIALRPENALADAVRGALGEVKGAYAIAVIDAVR